MKYIIISWLLSAVSLLIVAYIIPGFAVESFGTALIAAVAIGLINATIGLFLKVITLPISILTLGIFLLAINALMLMLASSLVSGFEVQSYLAAFLGAIVLALVGIVFRKILADD